MITIEKGVGDGGNKWRGKKTVSENVWYLDQNMITWVYTCITINQAIYQDLFTLLYVPQYKTFLNVNCIRKINE